jgi:hypothetical protein
MELIAIPITDAARTKRTDDPRCCKNIESIQPVVGPALKTVSHKLRRKRNELRNTVPGSK